MRKEVDSPVFSDLPKEKKTVEQNLKLSCEIFIRNLIKPRRRRSLK